MTATGLSPSWRRLLSNVDGWQETPVKVADVRGSRQILPCLPKFSLRHIPQNLNEATDKSNRSDRFLDHAPYALPKQQRQKQMTAKPTTTRPEGTEPTMKNRFANCLTALVAGVLICPAPLLASEKITTAAVRDIELTNQKAIAGAVVTPEGAAVAGEKIEVFSNAKLIARVQTDARGRFQVKGLRPGIHVVRSRFGAKACRFWSPGTAPPSARTGMVLTSGKVVRGQICGEDICGEECGGCGEGCCSESGGCPLLTGSMTAGTLLAAGGFAAVTATTIAVSSGSSSSNTAGNGGGGVASP